MRAIYVKPGKRPVTVDIEDKLKILEEMVEGEMDVIYPFGDDPVAIICHADGKDSGLKPNRALRDGLGNPQKLVFGSFLIVGMGKYRSLSESFIKKYTELFKKPERFKEI